MSIKQATLTLTWPRERGYQLDEDFARTESVDLRAICAATMTSEEWYTQVVEMSGDLTEAREVLADCPVVTEFDVMGTTDAALAFMECRTTSLVDEFVAVERDNDVFSNFPVYYLPHGPGQKRQVIGSTTAISAFVEGFPDFISIELESKTDFRPIGPPADRGLTERQQEVLAVANREGYYEVPRKTTQEELASILDLSPGTVSEHLQRIEAKLVSGYESG